MPVYSIQKVLESLEDHSWSISHNKKTRTYIATRSGNMDIHFFENSMEEICFCVDGWICSDLENAVKKSRKVR